MNYTASLAYLKLSSVRGARLGLERVTELLERLGDPQNQVKVVHIAGTNGKGSVGAMLASILTHSGYRTGHFASPALTSPRDYFRLCGREITEEQFADVLTEVAFHAEQMADAPTEFELLAAIAYTFFAKEQCDVAVVECCMGGDMDCTNVIEKSVLSIITNIQYDHQAFLGNTAAEIAAHKAGIIKPFCPVLFDAQHSVDCTFSVIHEMAEQCHAPLYLIHGNTPKIYDVRQTLDGTAFVYNGHALRTPLLGTYQVRNLELVLHAIELLCDNGLSISDDGLAQGLAHVQWHGRFELLSRDPVIVFDGAHNPDGIRSAQQSLQQYFHEQKLILLIGVMADKEYTVYPELLGNMAAHVFTVKPDNSRALDAHTLAETFTAQGIPATACDSLLEGVQLAHTYAQNSQTPLAVLGSLYMYHDFCEALEHI